MARFLAVADDERAMVRRCTLGRNGLDIVSLRRTPHTRLGCAILLCCLQHPGRIPGPDERPPSALLERASGPTRTPPQRKPPGLERIKWLLWHGNPAEAIDAIEDLADPFRFGSRPKAVW